MSDLGKLFQLCGWGPKPLENFTTTALAIAVNHDHRPMQVALRAVNWRHKQKPDRPPLAQCTVAPETIQTITADTQVTLWKQGGTAEGYLDLVLHIIDADQRDATIWVEVKVDAWESGMDLIRIGGHLSCGGYDVQTDGRHTEAASAPPIH